MTRRINFEDNLFYLNVILKQVAAGLKLNIDGDLYRERILADLAFANRTLHRLHRSLEANPRMIDRIQVLHRLQQTMGRFLELLDSLKSAEALPGAAMFEPDQERLATMRTEREQDVREIREAMRQAGASTAEEEHIVSAEEFRSLLSPEPEEEEER